MMRFRDMIVVSLEFLLLELSLNIRKPPGIIELLFSLDILHLVNDPPQKLDASLLAILILEDKRPRTPNHVSPPDSRQDPREDELDEEDELRVDGGRIDGEERLEQACEHGDEFLAEVEVVGVDDLENGEAVLGVIGVDQVRQDAHAVDTQILREKLDVVVYVPVHTHTHVAEQTLVDSQDSLVDLLWQDGVHALV